MRPLSVPTMNTRTMKARMTAVVKALAQKKGSLRLSAQDGRSRIFSTRQTRPSGETARRSAVLIRNSNLSTLGWSQGSTREGNEDRNQCDRDQDQDGDRDRGADE